MKLSECLDKIECCIEIAGNSTDDMSRKSAKESLDNIINQYTAELYALAESLPLNTDASHKSQGLDSIIQELASIIVYSYGRRNALSLGEHYFLCRFFDNDKVYDKFLEHYEKEAKYNYSKYRFKEDEGFYSDCVMKCNLNWMKYALGTLEQKEFYELLPESLVKLYDAFGSMFITANNKKASDEDRANHLLQMRFLYGQLGKRIKIEDDIMTRKNMAQGNKTKLSTLFRKK